VCFVGDSFVAGVGDPDCLGWVGRVAARTSRTGLPLTVYNLGVRRQTSEDVRARWADECTERLPSGADCRVVFSLGVNDTTEEASGPRVPLHRSGDHLAAMLDTATAAGWPAFVVGPPPVADEAHNRRTALVDRSFAGICAAGGAPYVGVLTALAATPVWMEEVRTGDGAHPGASGYAAFADLVWPAWTSWLTSPITGWSRAGAAARH
jgi:lysophospholipase L1-like esterase